jgi:hypothetical protein
MKYEMVGRVGVRLTSQKKEKKKGNIFEWANSMEK